MHEYVPGQSSKPTLQEVVEKIGLGPAHLRYCLTGGGVNLADGAELLLITAVTGAVASDWGLGSYQRGLAVTIVFIGVLIGNVICGPMGDRYGRHQLIIASYIGIFIFSLLSSLTGAYYSFCLCRLFVGFSFGIGQPAWFTLCTEVTPRYWRMAMNGCSQTLFVAGEIYSAAIILADDPDLKHLHWRRLLQLGAIPAALFAFASALFLLPSPSFLALHGETDSAKDVLEAMKRDNFCDASISTDFQVVPPVRVSNREFGYQIKELFGRRFISSTLIVGSTCCGMNLVYYGCLYAFPQILPEVQGGGSAGVQLLLGALIEVPGNILGILFGMWLARKPVIKLYLMLMALSLGSFVLGISAASPTWATQGLYLVGYYGIKINSCIGFVVVYQYVAEIYPTETRASGTAVCTGSGRLGAIMAPLVYEGIQDVLNSNVAFFYLLSIFCIVNCMLIDFLPYETADMLLKDRLTHDDLEDDTEAYGAVSSYSKDTTTSGKAEEADISEMNLNLDDGCTMAPVGPAIGA